MTAFTVPIAVAYNTRIGATNVLPGASGIVGAGIVGVMIVGLTGTTSTKDQRMVNCFNETVVNTFTNTKTIYAVKRPGFASLLTPQAGSIGTAIMVWTGSSSKIISAFGSTNSSIYDSVTQLVTNNADTTVITGKARSITETSISSTATLTIASTDSTAWYYQPAGTITKISDGQYPGNNSLTTVGGFAHMDGYAFIMDSTGGIWNSDLNSVTAWTATSVLQANSYPDAGVGVFRLGDDKIVAMGTESVQFFYNANVQLGSPLQRITPLTLKVGCVSADAVTEANGVLYWCGSSPQGGISIHSYGPGGYQKASPPEIDSILILCGTGNISLSATKFYGRSFVIVQASTVTFVYCVEERSWHEWSGAVPLWYKCAGISAGSSQVTYSVSNISTAGKVFVINPASMTFQDNSAAFSAVIQTNRFREGTKRTFWHEIGVLGDRHASTSPLSISYTDDDYQTYTTLGTVDLTDERPRLQRCGNSYSRAWVLTHAANTPMRLLALTGDKSTSA